MWLGRTLKVSSKGSLSPNDPEGNTCESEIFIRSYDQEADDYEGIDVNWIHWDEPPPRPILQAAERGKVVTNAPSWFTMTPLKEAYIYDEYSLKASNNGGDDDEIAVFRGKSGIIARIGVSHAIGHSLRTL